MIFRRIVLSALLVGALAGLLLSIVQFWQVIPIIHSAERFESARAPPPQGHTGHEHPADAWEPAEGAERVGYTLLSNVLTAAGFGLMMLAAMVALHKRTAVTKLNWRHGLLWGAAGYIIFFVAPSLGLPPQIPGAAETPLEARQFWWALTVACTAIALAGVAFGKDPWRWAALGLLTVPYLAGIPHPAVNPFAEYPPAAATELTDLARQFVWATALANAVFWLTLGAASVWAVRRFMKKALAQA
jgi:cobalt transporter subunit CbtA